MNNGVYMGHMKRLYYCLVSVNKSPIFSFLMLPTGPFTGGAAHVNGAYAVYLILCFLIVVGFCWIWIRAQFRRPHSPPRSLRVLRDIKARTDAAHGQDA